MDRPPSPEKRPRPGRNPLRRGQSSRQNMQQIDSPPQTSSANLPSQAPQLEDPLIQTNTNRSTNRPLSPPQPQQDTIEPHPNAVPTPTRGSSLPMTNGIQSNREIASAPETQTPAPIPQSAQIQRDADGYNIPPSAVDDITRAQQEAAAIG